MKTIRDKLKNKIIDLINDSQKKEKIRDPILRLIQRDKNKYGRNPLLIAIPFSKLKKFQKEKYLDISLIQHYGNTVINFYDGDKTVVIR